MNKCWILFHGIRGEGENTYLFETAGIARRS